MYRYSGIVLATAGVLIALGGIYDVFIPRLPRNLAGKCAGNEAATSAIRELLRALGGCLIVIGAAVALVAVTTDFRSYPRAVGFILMLVLPSEGINAFGMRRVGSPYVVPLVFILLTIVGAVLALVPA